MKNTWKISVSSEIKERIALTYGDPADALVATDNYARKPLPEAIENWQAISTLLQPDHWYDVTAFYSHRKANLTKESANQLHVFNQQAFDAAKQKGGLILYFQGVLIGNDKKEIKDKVTLPFIPNCLSFCIWETLREAKVAAKIPEHKKAAQMISLWYDGFAIVKYRVKLRQTTQKKELVFEKTP